MTSIHFLLCLLCLYSYKKAVMTRLSPPDCQQRSVISAHVGQTITMKCCNDKTEIAVVFWYKHVLGQIPMPITTTSNTLIDGFDNSRFTLDFEVDHYNLIISNVNSSDSAVYLCAKWDYRELRFMESITVSVRAAELNDQVVVHQPQFENFQPGGSVNLSCTVHPGSCDGEHSVYWFLSSGEHQPGLLYTSGGRSDQCEKKPNTQTHTCVYNLPLNISNSGTYYCAVASCGHILFGKGTKVESQADEVNLTYLMYAALTFTSILSVFLSVLLVKRNKENCCKCSDSTREISAPSTTNEEGYGDEENLHYAALSVHNRTRRRMDNVENDCVYSSVRH
ncbi:uncharacterized protein LOC103391507 isoform X1 [Cynoglossus semilaevis]|uniref:uncharacterized protein LOC103391507 isoform X1 n=1 Tax=Cynoglossus semilaevis TaxID=244447 RepID=UPI000D630174|nr:uncharacterized protein LOC103391507 isoform X1 [Cynoglossus semilaevis]